MKLQATQLIAQVKIFAFLFFHLSYLPLIHQLGPVFSTLQLYPKSSSRTLSPVLPLVQARIISGLDCHTSCLCSQVQLLLQQEMSILQWISTIKDNF